MEEVSVQKEKSFLSSSPASLSYEGFTKKYLLLIQYLSFSALDIFLHLIFNRKLPV